MRAEQLLGFGPYRLDLGREQVWKGKHAVKLPPKALALLRVLVTRAGQVVTKEELLEVGWPQTVVSDDALTSCLQELRRALGDDARHPRYIETVHRRGFRFIAPVAASAAPVSSFKFQVSGTKTRNQKLETSNQKLETLLVGRAPELAQLHGWLEKALRGERQVVFVTGEPGIGKTTLVEAFLQRLIPRRVGTAHHEAGRARAGTVGDAHPTTHPQSLTPNPQAEAEAEACFWKAIEIARWQSAKSLELRAVMSLSRLWQQQGKTKQARQMLAEIYNWFTEGFGTKDLQEAKALLEELENI